MLKNVLISLTLFGLLAMVNGCSSSELTQDKLTRVIRSSPQSLQIDTQSDNYVLRQGDQIQFSVWGYPEFSTATQVKELGTVTIPLIGEVNAVGLSKEQFIQQMKQKLSEYIQGEIKLAVTIVSSVTQRVTVLGAVSRQENYPLTSDATLLEILSTAGGTTLESDLRNIKILRNGQSGQPIHVDLTWFIENGEIESIPTVRPGDTIFVPRKDNMMRELSDFMRDAIFIFGFFRIFN
ncbi:MAG: polysaccharide export protein [Ignavibacteriae bacterium]|nr:polysaccharide export protein [Ignavibacteriota bacterium]